MAKAARLPRWWPLPFGVVVGAVAGGAHGELQTPQYAATSYVVVVPTTSDPATALGYAQAYGRVAVQTAVLDDAHARAGVRADVLRSGVQAATSPDAPMISITGTASRPGVAAALANTVTSSLIASTGRAERSTGVEVRQFARAVRPTAPVSISPGMATLVGGSAGGLLGGLALLVRPQRRPGEVPGEVPEEVAAVRAPAAVPGPAAERNTEQEVVR
jgi:capsular polysaccharide biosynthesis protein